MFYDRHLYYFNMTTPGLRVDLVNMVREPVARVVSNFYFVRNPSRYGSLTTALG